MLGLVQPLTTLNPEGQICGGDMTGFLGSGCALLQLTTERVFLLLCLNMSNIFSYDYFQVQMHHLFTVTPSWRSWRRWCCSTLECGLKATQTITVNTCKYAVTHPLSDYCSFQLKSIALLNTLEKASNLMSMCAKNSHHCSFILKLQRFLDQIWAYFLIFYII